MKNILIVDDIEENRYMLASLLAGNGYHVEVKANGDEALKWAKQNPPDLAISDILMPIMDGFELCKQWKKDETLKHIPFIIYTATYTDAKDEKLALELGADRFIIKPQKPEVLLEIIKNIINDYENRNQIDVAPITADELSFLSQHREALVRKLGRKLQQLENEIIQHKQTLNFLDSIIENIPSIIFIKETKNLTFVRINKAAEEFLGITKEELIGKTDYDIFPFEQADTNVKADKVVITEKRMIEIAEAELNSKTKGKRFIRARKVPLFDEKNEVIFILGIAEDITEQKKLTEERNRLQQQIWHSQKLESIGKFAGSIAHDFNNHLSVIMGYTNLLLNTLACDDPKRADLLEIYRASESAAALSKQLLTFSRKQVMECTNIDLNTLLKSMKGMLRRLIPENISLEFIPSHKPAVVWTDPSQMEQVIMNLVVNSRDAMPAGGKLVISIELRSLSADEIQNYEGEAGNFVVLSVSDTGIGMNEEIISHIFEPFYTTKEVGKGVGLGLATVYGIVKQSGGFIRVESSVGIGTKMQIFLPESKKTKQEQTALGIRDEIKSWKGNETLLVIEDDEALLGLIEKILVPAGYSIIKAKCCAEAEQYFTSIQKIDAMICDVVLPDGRGNEFFEKMQKKFPHLRALFMSGYGDEKIMNEIPRMKHAKMILKPFSEKELKALIRSLFD